MRYEGGGESEGSKVYAGCGEASSCTGGFEKQETYDVVLMATGMVVSMYSMLTVPMKTWETDNGKPETGIRRVGKQSRNEKKTDQHRTRETKQLMWCHVWLNCISALHLLWDVGL
jgi:hypothetical protein